MITNILYTYACIGTSYVTKIKLHVKHINELLTVLISMRFISIFSSKVKTQLSFHKLFFYTN